mgnify:CR=1 FL=1
MVSEKNLKDIDFCLLDLTNISLEQCEEMKEEMQGFNQGNPKNEKLQSFLQKASDNFILVKVFHDKILEGVWKESLSFLLTTPLNSLQSCYYGSYFSILNFKTEEDFLINVQYTLNQIELGTSLDCYFAFFILNHQCFIVSLDEDDKATICDVDSYIENLFFKEWVIC